MTFRSLPLFVLLVLPLIARSQVPNNFFFPDLKFDSIDVYQYQDSQWQPYQSISAHWSGHRLDSVTVASLRFDEQERLHYEYNSDSTLNREVVWYEYAGVSNVSEIDSFYYHSGRLDRVEVHGYGGYKYRQRLEFSYDSEPRRVVASRLADTGWAVTDVSDYTYSAGRLQQLVSATALSRYFYDSTGALTSIIDSKRSGNDEAPTLLWEYRHPRLIHSMQLDNSVDAPLTSLVADTANSVLRVTNRSSHAVRLTSLTDDNSEFELKQPAWPIILGSDGVLTIPVQFHPHRRGRSEDDVTLHDDEGQYLTFVVSGTGRGSHLLVLPDTARFDDVPVSEESTASIVLINDGDGAIELDSISLTSPKFSAYSFQAQQLPEKGALGVTVQYLSDVSSFDTATIVLYTRGIQGARNATCVLFASAGKANGVAARKSSTLELYPNPCRSTMNVKVEGREGLYSILRTDGARVLNGLLKEGDNDVSVGTLSNGVYFLCMMFDNGKSATIPFVRAR